MLLSVEKSNFLHLKPLFFMKNNLKHTSFSRMIIKSVLPYHKNKTRFENKVYFAVDLTVSSFEKKTEFRCL